MGLSTRIIQFLIERQKSGVDFSHVATLGRQEFHIYQDEVASLIRHSHLGEHEKLVASSFDTDPPYAEPFFQALGARAQATFDNSGFEGATELHNFNEPLPKEYYNKYSVVFDGGSLEHIFNFPQAVRSCMLMVKEGGHFLGSSYANNLTGHGFYQFSPELMYRIFSEANGFGETQVFLVEQTGDGTVWSAMNPSRYGHRVELTNSRPTFVFVSSKRIDATRDPFLEWPSQSDYAERWQDHEQEAGTNGAATARVPTPRSKGKPLPGFVKKALHTLLPASVADVLKQWREEKRRQAKLKNPFSAECYKKHRG